MIHTGPKPRRIFARRIITIDGVRYRFEMTNDGVVVRRWHSHHPGYVKFHEMVSMAKSHEPPAPPPEPHPELF